MKIKDLPYSLKEITKNVFLVVFDSAYDVSMAFCRVQEFYESPTFKGKFFKMDDYMRHYALASKERKGVFTYPDEWRGFNVPYTVIEKVYTTLLKKRYDRLTAYDEVFLGILAKIRQKSKGQPYYVIGTSRQKGTKDVVTHEIAHGLYTTNPTYQARVDNLLRGLKPKVLTKMCNALKALNYHKSVWLDETNAYLSTGLHDTMDTKEVRKARKPFINLLKRFKKGGRNG